MKIKQHYISILTVIALFAVTFSTQAAMKCWKNKENIRECGHSVPQEFSQKRIEVLNDKGIITKVIPRAKTPEELIEFKRQEKIRKAKEQEVAAKKRQDTILLQTYTTEKDLLLARKQNIRAIESIIKITDSNTKTLKENLIILEKRAADAERNGEQPSETLVKDMNSLNTQIKDNQDFIDKKLEAQKEIGVKFDKDLKRFQKLKGIKPKPVNATVKP